MKSVGSIATPGQAACNCTRGAARRWASAQARLPTSACAAAVAGPGIAREPDFVGAPQLASGQWQRVLAGDSGPKLDVWAVYPSPRHLSAKVRTLVAHLAEVFAADPLRAPDRGAGPSGGTVAATAALQQ